MRANTRFTVYAGDRKYNVPSDNLKTAFDAAKTFSKYQGESYLYDKSIDKTIAHFIAGIRTQEGKQTEASRGIKYQHKGPKVNARLSSMMPVGTRVKRMLPSRYKVPILRGVITSHVTGTDNNDRPIKGYRILWDGEQRDEFYAAVGDYIFHDMQVKKNHSMLSNPRRTLIYGQVNRIIATKKQKHICDAECKRHGHRYFHDFTSKPKMYGLPNGDLLITTR